MELLPKPGGSDSTIHFLPPDTSKGGEIGKQNKAEEALGESLIFASESPLAVRFCSRERARVHVCIGGGGERSAEARLCPCVGTSGGEGSAGCWESLAQWFSTPAARWHHQGSALKF